MLAQALPGKLNVMNRHVSEMDSKIFVVTEMLVYENNPFIV